MQDIGICLSVEVDTWVFMYLYFVRMKYFIMKQK